MESQKIDRKIAVIFATDVVGFSTAMEIDEDQTLKNFRACKNILEDLFEEHGGRILTPQATQFWQNSRVRFQL